MADMLHAAQLGFFNLLIPEVFLFLVIGIASGLFFGLVPGLSGLTGMGMLLPFAIGQPPEVAFAFLLGMYAVTTQADAIPAILIGVPGTSAAQATYLDGYPMARRGEAGRALSASYFASVFGTIVFAGVILLILPFLRLIIDGFGAPEFFIFGVFGLVMAGSLVGDNVLRGLIVAAFGLLLATVGFTGATGEARYTFGLVYLEDGLPLVPVALGLFAIPEVVDLMIRGSSIADRTRGAPKGGALAGLRDVVVNGWLSARAAVIGGVCGVVPGLGGSVAEWLAYGHAVQTAKDNDRFGKGDVRGVLAAEASTAAQKPGALIPTVALGIPGNASMALLMGAFLIVGIRPGQEMLHERLPLTFQMVWTVVVANLIAAVACLVLQRYLIRLCYLPAAIIGPAILGFMVVGANMATNTFADLIVFLAAGVVGYVMKHTGWPRVPLIIGLVLGALVETNFVITSQIYGYSWLWERPIVLVVGVVCVLTIVGGIVRGYRKSRTKRP